MAHYFKVTTIGLPLDGGFSQYLRIDSADAPIPYEVTVASGSGSVEKVKETPLSFFLGYINDAVCESISKEEFCNNVDLEGE